MANIGLGQSINGAFTTDDPASSGYRLDQYEFIGLDDYRQLTIDLTCTNTITPLLINLIDTKTGAIVATQEAAVSGQGKISLSGTTVPGASYRLLVGGQSGNYTISTVDGGKATSLVSTTQGQGGRSQGIVTAGTVGASGKFFPLAASTLAFPLTDLALDSSGQFYGVGESASSLTGSVLYKIDPRAGSADQVNYAGGGFTALTAQIKDIQGNKLNGTIDAIEFANNKLYALSRTTAEEKLYTIEPTTRVATLVGNLPTGFVINGDDFVYDAANSRFLATAGDTATSDALWQIPIANPAGASKIGAIGIKGLTALDFENGQLTGFINGTNPTKVTINPTTGAGTLGQTISGLLSISGATTIVGANITNPTNPTNPTIPTNPNPFPTSPAGAIGTKSQGLAEGRTYDLTDYAGKALKVDVNTKGDAAYTNNIGFYVVTDVLTGTIKLANGSTLKPGDSNYAIEAIKSAVLQAGKIDSKLGLDVSGGSVYAPVVVAQGSLADFAAKNPTNSGDGNAIHAYFNYIGANPDKLDHFKLTGANTFAVEDQFGGGDRDFNDLIVNASFKTV
jgi:Domain of unknown function (DUF4114)